MSAFDERERGFEKKFATEQELEFRAHARCNRLLAEWAAKRMGLENSEDYVRAVVREDMAQPGEGDVLRKIIQDLAGAGLEIRESEIRSKMDELLATAREDVLASQVPSTPGGVRLIVPGSLQPSTILLPIWRRIMARPDR